MGIGGSGDGYDDERSRFRFESEGAEPGSRGRTRTRLPDDEAAVDAYEGARRAPVRFGRNAITVVGVVVLLMAAIAFANRSGGGDDSPGGDTGGGTDAVRPTAPSGEQPVAQQDDGIASGFPQTEQGAQSAAANYAVALASDELVDPDARERIVRRLFVPARTDQMLDRLNRAYSPGFLDQLGLDNEGKAADGMTYVSRTVPVGTRVRGYDGAGAELEVWCTGVYGMAGTDSTNPVTSDWFTVRMELRWSGGDWKVSSFAQQDGPTPINGDNPASTADEIAEAVEEYGGFTYAR